MFNVLSHKRNANQNDIEIPFCPSQNGYHQEHKQKMLKRMGERGRGIYTQCWYECKLVQPLLKSIWRFLKKLKIPYDPATPVM
jgi:hypothetical protein